MDGAVEFNLLHCVVGVALAVGGGFVVDYWVGRARQKSAPEPTGPNVKVEQPSVVSGTLS